MSAFGDGQQAAEQIMVRDRHVGLGLACAALLGLTSSAAGADLMPATPGNYWRLQSTEDPSTYSTYEVIGTAAIFGVEVPILEYGAYNTDEGLRHGFAFFKEIGDVVYGYQGGGSPNVWWCRGPVGTQCQSFDDGGPFTITLLGVGTVSVPAGTFNNCWHFRNEYVPAAQGYWGAWEEWVCEDIGLVRFEDKREDGTSYESFVLTDYRVW